MRLFRYISLCILLLFGSVGYSQSLIKVNPFNEFALLFDGVDEHLKADGVADGLNDNTAGTWSCWIFLNDLDGVQTFMNASANNVSAYYGVFKMSASGKLQMILSKFGAFAVNAFTDDLVLTAGAWHHVAVTGASTQYRFYVDAVLKPSNNTGTSRWFDEFSGNSAMTTMTIGAFRKQATINAFMDGKIDEVSMWTIEFNQAEINELYHSGFPTSLIMHSQVANLEGWWRMGDGAIFSTDWTIPDASANSNIGTSVNMEESDRVLSTLPSVKGVLQIGNNLVKQ